MIGRRAMLVGGLAAVLPRPARAEAEAALRNRILKAFGPALPMATGGDDPFARHDLRFRSFADRHWVADGPRWETANYYDRARIYYIAWARSGEPAWLQRAHALAVDYRDRYLIANRNRRAPTGRRWQAFCCITGPRATHGAATACSPWPRPSPPPIISPSSPTRAPRWTTACRRGCSPPCSMQPPSDPATPVSPRGSEAPSPRSSARRRRTAPSASRACNAAAPSPS